MRKNNNLISIIMKKLLILFITIPNLLLAQLIPAPADCDIAMRLCDANVSYNFQLVNDGIVDDAYPTLSIPLCNISQPNKFEAHSAFMKFTAKYSGQFGFTVCPESLESLSYIFLASPVCDNLESGAYTVAFMDDTALEDPNTGCRGMGDDIIINGVYARAFYYPFQNLVAGNTYMIFVRTRWYTQPGVHRFTITFQGSGIAAHPDFFDNVACNLAVTSTNAVFNNVAVYPNPFNEIININSNIALETTEIYNLVGERVYSQAFNNQIDTSFLSSGIYFIKLYGADNAVFVRKIVKR